MRNSLLQRSCLRVARAFVVGALAFALLGAAPATTKPAADQSFSQDELNALLAPIALYPDGLLSQVQERDVLPLHFAQRGECRGVGRDADGRLALLRDQRARRSEWHELLERAQARLH
jgi:Protein of unknown function (DUF3300)